MPDARTTPTIIITKTLESWWGTAEELASLTDKELVEMLREDVVALLDGASWEVRRA